MKTIVQNGDPVLRQIAQAVPVEEITSPTIQKVIKEMSVSLAQQDDGVAIAAPQIGYSLRIFIISGAVLKRLEIAKTNNDIVFINPEIIRLSKGKEWMEEGCLSVRWLYGKIQRSKQATIRAYDENGVLFERGGSGLIAQIFQHETDHLNGVLFIDSAKNIENMPPEENMEKNI